MFDAEHKPRPVESLANEGGGEQYSSLDTTRAILEGQELTFETPQAAYDLLSDLSLEARYVPDLPEAYAESVHTVMLAYGMLAYDHLRGSKQGIFLARLYHEREHLQINRVELSLDEAYVLQRIAKGAGLEYDPGTEETPEKRVFSFQSVESRPPQGAHDLDWYRLSTKRELLPEQATPSIVDSTPVFPATEE